MRLKALLNYYRTTTTKAIIIFFSFYAGGTLFGAVISGVATVNVGPVVSDGTEQWGLSIMGFIIFILILSLVNSQKETKFLITRSVSRKEIFTSYSIFLVPISAVLSALQILMIYTDNLFRSFFGVKFQGIGFDFQSLQAPNMKNIFVFFIVNLCIIFAVGALGFLLGSLMSRWKIPTIGAMIILFIAFIALFIAPGFLEKITEFFKFMLYDSENGLFIALKQFITGVIVLCISFPVMRNITAAK